MSLKILVVDDEPVVNKLLAMRLKNEGYEVDVAIDGQSAIDSYKKALTNTPYTIILLDIMLPIKVGTVVLEEIREAENVANISDNNRTPIIILSALTIPWMNKNQDPWNDYIVKPYKYPELLARIKEMISVE